MSTPSTLPSLFVDTDILVCIGSGGVGKTTFSAALAVLAAQEKKKVLVITVDPSKRLASALGISADGEVQKVPNQKFSGELFAATVEPKSVFDNFVKRAAKEAPMLERILSNRLYQKLSTTLSGSQEFTSLEKLYESFQLGQFDLIILDTPPAQHAIDFLEAPKKLAMLFSEKVSKWYSDPEAKKAGFLVSILHRGTKQMFKILELVTGSEFIHELIDLFQKLDGWQTHLERRTLAVHDLLLREKTKFCLVTSFDEAKLREADYLARKIVKSGYHLSHLVINRSGLASLDEAASDTKEKSEALQELKLKMIQYYAEKEELYLRFAKEHPDLHTIQVAEFDSPIQDLPGIENLARVIRVPLSKG